MPTNSIIIPGKGYLESRSEDLVDELLDLIRSIVPDGQSIKVSKLPFFNRIVLVFPQIPYAQQIHELLQDAGIENFYSLRNNKVDGKDSELLDTGDTTEPVNSRMPNNESNKLEPPRNTIQLKSPPASPYLGWVNEPEDPPDESTVTDPRSLADILYEPSECKQDELRRVFSRRGSVSDYSNNELDDFDLGEGEHDVEKGANGNEGTTGPNIKKKLQRMKPINIGSDLPQKSIPILMIGNEEAEHLRAVSRKLESANHSKPDL